MSSDGNEGGIEIVGQEFVGPLAPTQPLPTGPGIFVALDLADNGREFRVLGAHFVPRLEEGGMQSARSPYWVDCARGRLAFAYFTTLAWPEPAGLAVMAKLWPIMEPDSWHEHWSYAAAVRAEGAPKARKE